MAPQLADAPHITANTLQLVTCNLKARFRSDSLEGLDYYVVPMVMLTEGVHNGSNGPLYYPPEELAKTPVVWNHKPIVVYHPQLNGQSVSACDKVILESRKVGVILNTRFIGNKLKAEAWLRKDRLGQVDKRVLNALEKGQPIEVSTGLFTDNQGPGGTWNGESYVATARNYRPDHLAILPDQKGSCSISDGAGLLMNADKNTSGKTAGNHSTRKDTKMNGTATKEDVVDEIIANAKSGWSETDRDFLLNLDDDKLDKVAANAADDTVEEELEDETTDKKGNKKPGKGKAADAVDPTDPTTGGKGQAAASKTPVKAKEQAPVDNETIRNALAGMTADEYLDMAPDGVGDMLRSGMAAFNAEKGRVIATITANKANTFTEDFLGTKSMDELRAISKLAANTAPRTPRYVGEVNGITANVGQQDVLVAPGMTFEQK